MLTRSTFNRILTAVTVACFATATAALAAPVNYTCSGGSIPSGIYSNLVIGGNCTIDTASNGSVIVQHDVTLLANTSLQVVTGSLNGVGSNAPLAPDLTVGGDLIVKAGAVLNLGCGGVPFPCINDPDPSSGTFETQITVAGNLYAEGAAAVVVHFTDILGSVVIKGGGGGLSCSASVPVLFGAPYYDDLENVQVGGDVVMTGVQSCWLGMFRDTVGRNVVQLNNATLDPDGNELAHNTVAGRLDCRGNSPANQTGDSLGGPNTVLNHGWAFRTGNGQDDLMPGASGSANQCAGIIVH